MNYSALLRKMTYKDKASYDSTPTCSDPLYVIFRKRATNYRALLRKMTYKDKASYDSTPTCSDLLYTIHVRLLHTCFNTQCAVRPSVLQLTATHATATHTSGCDVHAKYSGQVFFGREPVFIIGPSPLHSNSLQHTPLQHPATHYNTH